MEAARSNLALRLSPGSTKAVNFHGRTPLIRLAPKSRGLFGACRGVKLSSLSAGGSRKGLECRSSVLENEGARKADDLPKKKLAVFVSGGGSNFRSIHEATVRGSVHGDVVVLVTDKPGCGGAQYASDNGIPVILFPKTKSLTEGLLPTELLNTLKKFGADFLLLAGYLKLIPIELIQAYPKSILNIHPSLLPAFGGKGFYGIKVHKAVIASGARYSGPTVHFVDEHYDTGCILAQRVVPVLANDSADQLAGRVLNENVSGKRDWEGGCNPHKDSHMYLEVSCLNLLGNTQLCLPLEVHMAWGIHQTSMTSLGFWTLTLAQLGSTSLAP